MTQFSESPEQQNAEQSLDQARQAAANQAENVVEQIKNTPEQATEQAESLSSQVANQVESAKAAVTKPLPTPAKLTGGEASPEELLQRLNWGEPALTILDIRSREAFNAERITGAVSAPSDQMPGAVESTLEHQRDIYLYGDGAEAATQVVQQLRQAGYQNVALLRGGLSAWKAIKGPTEGQTAFASPAGAKA